MKETTSHRWGCSRQGRGCPQSRRGKLSKDEILRMIDDLVAEEETVTVDAGGAEQTKLNEIFKAIDKERKHMTLSR